MDEGKGGLDEARGPLDPSRQRADPAPADRGDPKRTDQRTGIALCERFLREQFVAEGMVVDAGTHCETASDGGTQPHLQAVGAELSRTPGTRAPITTGTGYGDEVDGRGSGRLAD